MNQETMPRQLARDVRSDILGEVTNTSRDGRHVWMRPIGGGQEWYVPRAHVQMIDTERVA